MTGVGYLPSCWLEVSHRPPKQYYCHYTILYIVITLSVTNKAIVLAYPPEPGGKTLLLKSPHTLVTGHRKTKSVLNRKLQPWQQAFRTLKSAMQVRPAVNLMHYSRDRESYTGTGRATTGTGRASTRTGTGRASYALGCNSGVNWGDSKLHSEWV